MTPDGVITTVVLIGHLLMAGDQPAQLARGLKTQAPTQEIHVEVQDLPGASLRYQWNHADRAEGIDARSRLTAPADVVILSETIPLTTQLRWNDTDGAIVDFYTLAAASNPDVTLYVTEGWHSLLSGTGADIPFDEGAMVPWRKRIELDRARWQTRVDLAREQTGGDIRLLPLGSALGVLWDQIEQGQLEASLDQKTGINAFFKDDLTPNDWGGYFLALVQLGVLTGQLSIENSGLTPPSEMPQTMQRNLAEIAHQAVFFSSDSASGPPDPGVIPRDPEPVWLNEPVWARSEAQLARNGNDPERKHPIAMNLAAIADWSPQAPFLDHFKTARDWIGHRPGQWGGIDAAELAAAGYLDENGWPRAIPSELGSIGTVILTDLPPEALSLAGRYVLFFEGDGIIEVSGRASNVRYEPGRIAFDYTPGPGAVELRLQRTDRQKTGDYIRNISVVREADIEAWRRGALFNPLWLDRIEGFAALRFSDWMKVNATTLSNWQDRPRPSDYSWAVRGVPHEVLIRLANEIGADPWFTIPHRADDGYVHALATAVSQGLDSDLTAYVEYSNEPWNQNWPQGQWAAAQAGHLWGDATLALDLISERAAEIAQIWQDVFDAPGRDRLMRVLSVPTHAPGREQALLTAPQGQDATVQIKPPASHFDAYAISGYFGSHLGQPDHVPMVRAWMADSLARAGQQAQSLSLSHSATQSFLKAHRHDIAASQAALEIEDGLISGAQQGTLHDLTTRLWPYHAEVAAKHGLELIMYEGGSHLFATPPMDSDEKLTAFLTHFSYSEEMAALYETLINRWVALGGQLFTAYDDVSTPGPWGNWGHLRWLSDDTPRWQVLEAWR